MAGELDIRGGGAVAVDTETLRHTAARFLQARSDLQAISDRVGSLQLMLLAERAHAWEAVSAASVLGTSMHASLDGAAHIAEALRSAAVVYELVELNAQHRAAVLAGDDVALARLDAARDRLIAQNPDAFAEALGAEFERSVMWPSDLVRQATELGFATGENFGELGGVYGGAGLGLATIAGAGFAGVAGTGRLAAESRLAGRGVEVTLVPVTPLGTMTAAPSSLTAVTQRMPGARESRVRVERYSMPDGSRQFAVYVAGTQSFAVGGDEPWDNLSNAQLYTRNASASYEATAAALTAAGAQPGDRVTGFGHSQGAMILAHVALEEGYDTRMLVSFGSPVEAELGEGTLSVGVRHTDDPVAALAGGGHVAPVGSHDSFVVERETDPAAGPQDALLPGHRMTAYAETAALIDASPDPRVGAVRAVLDDLTTAVSVEVMEFGAKRTESAEAVSSPSSGAG